MTVVLDTRSEITLDAVRRVAWQGEDVRIGERALACMAECRDAFVKLLASDPDITIHGVTTGYGQMARIKLTPEQRETQAARTFLPAGEGGGFGQNDVASPSFFAWIKERDAGAFLDASLAILAAIASQALRVTERPATPPLADLLDEVRAHFPPVTDMRALGPVVDRLAAAFSARVYPQAPVG